MRKFTIMVILLTLLAVLTGGAAAQEVPDPAITITSPGWGALVTNEGTITVSGIATNLFEGGLVVQALDNTGILLAEQPVTAAGAALGGTGSWTVDLPVTGIAAGTPGQIFAFSTSSMDGSIAAQASVTVTFGTVPAVDITITSPVEGTIVNPANGIVITGTTTNIFEAQFTLEVRDAAGSVLAQTPVTSSTATGTGTWQAVINLQFVENMTGSIYAYDASNVDNTVVASDTVNVTFQANCTPNTTWPLYTVVVGDNLFRIAERTGSTMDELAQANCITNRSVIVVGTQLRVPHLPDAEPGPGTGGNAQLAITAPNNNDTVAPGTIVVNGTGASLFENGLVVRLLDDQGRVLAEQPTTLANVQADGSGVWQVVFDASTYQGKYATVVAYSGGGYGGAPVVSDSINLFLSQQAIMYITIETPRVYGVTDGTTVTLSGQARGLFENTLQVAAYDSTGQLLASHYATAAAPDLGLPGPWSVDLIVDVPMGTHGWVEAYELSARDGSVLNYTRRDVVYGAGSAAGPFVTIEMPLPWDSVRLAAGGAAGTLGGLPANGHVWAQVLNAHGKQIYGPVIVLVTADGLWNVSFESSAVVVVGEGSLVVYFTDSTGTVLAYDSIPVVFQP